MFAAASAASAFGPPFRLTRLCKKPLLFRSTASTQGTAPDEDLRSTTIFRQTLPTTEHSRRNKHPETAPDPNICPTIATRSRIVPEEWNVLARLQDGDPFRFAHTGQRFGDPADLIPISSKAPNTTVCTFDNDQDVIDLTVDDIAEVTVDTGLVDRGQLALTSIRLLGVATQAGSFQQVVLRCQSTGAVTIRGTPAIQTRDGVAKLPEIPDEACMLLHRDDDRGSQDFMDADLCDVTWVHPLTITNIPRLLPTRPLDLPPEAGRPKEADGRVPSQSGCS
ncbi:hypothetical protein Focb16_v005432 [Fusarium oxysporum f. sp. cubense]|uniref:Uncharacterized protein n=1 Tax=Fusarium oxysporum f. sp. cubense TaxID=61366 RepID=A0A559LKN2_FUSOC|nr:hypothetical protein Focb16_v005432 [Fusarium oxysporum f. sp. cubense]